MFTNTLSDNAQKSLAVLGESGLLVNAYLAGGSGLALHLGHRISVDFDFFTTTNFNQEQLASSLAKAGSFTTRSMAPDTLLGTFNKISFSIFRYDYPLLFPTVEFSGVNLADRRDIAAMKIAAVMDRGTKKDFIDLYFLAKENINLDECLEYYDKKYKVLASNIYSIIRSLSYFDQAEESKMPIMLKPVSWKGVKKFFEKEAVRLAKEHL